MTSEFSEYNYPGKTSEYGPAQLLGDFSHEIDVQSAIFQMKIGTPLALDNDLVWAIWGDAANDRFVNELLRIKGREAGRALGLTVPFEQVAHLADLERIHPNLRPLLEDPECHDLKARLSAISFVRFPGDSLKILDSDLPECVRGIDPETGLPLLQTYDPTGKYNIEFLLEQAAMQGVKYASASSLNCSTEKEIIECDIAVDFASDDRRHLPILTDVKAAMSGRSKGKGSYPIVAMDNRGLAIVREGSVGNDIIRQLLSGYGEVRLADGYREANYAERVMHLEDLPQELQGMNGAELAQELRVYLGWQ